MIRLERWWPPTGEWMLVATYPTKHEARERAFALRLGQFRIIEA